MVEAVNTACDAMSGPTCLAESMETLEAHWANKVPTIRAGALGWTARLVLKTPKSGMLKLAKPIAAAMDKPLADKVRALGGSPLSISPLSISPLSISPLSMCCYAGSWSEECGD